MGGGQLLQQKWWSKKAAQQVSNKTFLVCIKTKWITYSLEILICTFETEDVLPLIIDFCFYEFVLYLFITAEHSCAEYCLKYGTLPPSLQFLGLNISPAQSYRTFTFLHTHTHTHTQIHTHTLSLSNSSHLFLFTFGHFCFIISSSIAHIYVCLLSCILIVSPTWWLIFNGSHELLNLIKSWMSISVELLDGLLIFLNGD